MKVVIEPATTGGGTTSGVLHNGNLTIPVAPEVFRRLEGRWTEPVEVRLDRQPNGSVEMTMRPARDRG